MKKVLLFLFIISLSAKGQTNVYHPFPDSGAVWCGQEWSLVWTCPTCPCQLDNDYSLFMNGDTIIGNYKYHKLFSSGYRFYHCPPSGKCCYYFNNYVCSIREDTTQKKVFIVPYNSTTDTLLYDFNLSLGDTLPASFNNNYGDNYVSGVDSVLSGGNYRKRFWLGLLGSTKSWEINYVTLVEGIGSSFGLLDPLIPPFESGSELLCFRQNIYDTTCVCNVVTNMDNINDGGISISLFPNPATDKITISGYPSSKEARIEIYNMMGEKVYQSAISSQKSEIEVSSLAKGVYILRMNEGGRVDRMRFIKE